MGAIKNERYRKEMFDPTANDSLAVLRARARMDEIMKQEEDLRKSESRLTRTVKSKAMPAGLIGAGLRFADLAAKDNPMLSKILQSGYLASKVPSQLLNNDANRKKINDLKAKKEALAYGAGNSGGGFKQIASNTANVGQQVMKVSSGLYAGGAAANLLGYGSIGGQLTSIGKYGFMHNPMVAGSALANASSKAAGQFSTQYLPNYLAHNLGGALQTTGLYSNAAGKVFGLGGLSTVGEGISGLGKTLSSLDITGGTGTMLGMLMSMGLSMGSMKLFKNIGKMGGINSTLYNNKSIRPNIPNGFKVFDQYFTGKGLESIHNMYMSSQMYKSPFESIMVSIALVQAKSLAGLPAIYEILAGNKEGNTVGGRIAQNDHELRFATTKKDDIFSSSFRDPDKTFSYYLNKLGVSLEETITKTGMVLNPMNWMSLKNNPYQLLKQFKIDTTVKEAKNQVAKSNGISLTFLNAVETPFTKSVAAGQTVEEKILLATMHIGEIIRGESLLKKRANGKRLQGQVQDTLNKKRHFEDKEGNFLVDGALDIMSIIPLLGPAAALTLKGIGNTLDFSRNIGKHLKKVTHAFDFLSISKARAKSKSTLKIGNDVSDKDNFYKYMSSEFPNRFEELLSLGMTRNNYIKMIAEKLGVDKKTLDSGAVSTGKKWINELGGLFTKDEAKEKLSRILSTLSKKQYVNSYGEMSLFGQSFFKSIKPLDKYLKKNIKSQRTQSANDFNNKLNSIFDGTSTRLANSANASQQALQQQQQTQNTLNTFTRMADTLEEIRDQIKDCCEDGNGGTSINNSTRVSGVGILGRLGELMGIGSSRRARARRRLMGRGLRRLVGGILPYIKRGGAITAAIELAYYSKDIYDWVSKEYKNLKEGDYKQFFGLKNEAGEDITKKTWGFGGDVADTLWMVASTSALMFPSPFTLGFAALAGMYKWGPDILKAGETALHFVKASFGLDDSFDENRQDAIHKKRCEMHPDLPQCRKKKHSTQNTTQPIVQKNPNIKDHPTIERYQSKNYGLYFGQTKEEQRAYLSFINSPTTETDWVKLLQQVRRESDLDKSGTINSQEELNKIIEELTKHQKEFTSLNAEGQTALIEAINRLSGDFRIGQIHVADVTKDAVDGLKIVLNKNEVWSFGKANAKY